MQKKARILEAQGKDYSFDGRSGTSYKARLLIENNIYPVKCTAEDIETLKPHVGKDVLVNLSLVSPKENIRLEFVSVESSK